MNSCFTGAEILLPNPTVSYEKWACVACDQYTSQPDYWQCAADFVGEAPSTLQIIFPEVYLEQEPARRIAAINANMQRFLDTSVLIPAVSGFVLVERDTPSGKRLGLVGKVDLEQYDYRPGTAPAIRATEQTVVSRIPPRVRIRENAALEAPHIMLLIDDAEMRLIEPLYARRDSLRKVYDTELMQNGGHLRGYAVEGSNADALQEAINAMEAQSSGFFLAVGDGNHSLATAKACWDAVKPTLSPAQQAVHPARYALVEVVNLHSPALIFEPIHRVLFHTALAPMLDTFTAALAAQGMTCVPGDDLVFMQGDTVTAFSLGNAGGRLPVEVVQKFLDDYLKQHPEGSIDYIHGQEAVEGLVAAAEDSCGLLLKSIDKHGLFPAIAAGGVLPRKTFSMGEADEKRYYMECRKIR